MRFVSRRRSVGPVLRRLAAGWLFVPSVIGAALVGIGLVGTGFAQEEPASGNGEGVEVVDRVVALVNGDMITLSELERQVVVQAERLGVPDDPEIRTAFREQVLTGMVDNALILQVAEQRGLRVPDRYFDEWKEQTIKEMNLPDEAEFVRQVELQGTTMEELKKQFLEGVLIQEIRRQDIEERVRISQPEVEQRYRENVDEFIRRPQIRLRELVVHVTEAGEEDARSRLAEAQDLIRSGNEFGEVAKVRSESASAESGGDLGLFELTELDDSFREVVAGLEAGQVSEPIRIGDSFYLLEVVERTEESTIPLDEVQNQIADSLHTEKMEAEMRNFVRKLRENAIVHIRLEETTPTTTHHQNHPDSNPLRPRIQPRHRFVPFSGRRRSDCRCCDGHPLSLHGGHGGQDLLLLGMYAMSLVLSGITMKFVLQTEKKQEIERNRRNKLEFSWDDWQTSIWVDAYLIFLRRQAAPHSHAVDFTFRLAFNNYGEGIRLLEERGLKFRVRNHRGEEGRCVDDKMLQFSPIPAFITAARSTRRYEPTETCYGCECHG